ncbi:MAG: hypothetical protein WBW41_08755 [Verrucomicrobiia bacterium]
MRHSAALFIAHHNFCRVHKTLKIKATEIAKAQERTPAMAAGLENCVWTIKDLLKIDYSTI